MCDSGRKLSATSSPPNGTDRRPAMTFAWKLSCVSITPLGLPVVPEE